MAVVVVSRHAGLSIDFPVAETAFASLSISSEGFSHVLPLTLTCIDSDHLAPLLAPKERDLVNPSPLRETYRECAEGTMLFRKLQPSTAAQVSLLPTAEGFVVVRQLVSKKTIAGTPVAVPQNLR